MNFLILFLIAFLQIPIINAQDTMESSTNNDRRVMVKFEENASWLGKRWTYLKNGALQANEIIEPGIEIIEVPENLTPEEVADKFAEEENVEFVEIDTEIPSAEIPNDSNYAISWHHNVINSSAAWSISKANGIKIAVCDSGFDVNHPDLKNILIPELGYNTHDNNKNWAPHDNNQHGNRVSGIVAGETNNNLFVSGIAWGAKIIPIRITYRIEGEAAFTLTSNIVECITYAADNEAKVINISYTAGESTAIRNAASYAEDKGSLVVMSVGNDNKLVEYPNYDSIIVASATTSADNKASFSNQGAAVDISAPGEGIQTIWTSNGDYISGSRSGTSYSAPIIAGVIATISATNPRLSVSQIKSILFNTSDDKGTSGYDQVYGHGRVNFHKAIDTAKRTAPVSSKTGDANNDQKVDGLDYVVWLNNYQTNTTAGPSEGDFNQDGKVDGLDYVVWLNNYQK